MIHDSLCDKCRNNEQVECLRGSHIEFRPACVYQVIKFPRAQECNLYERDESK